MSRIQLDDSLLEATMKIANGNPGAASVIVGITKHGHEIDPDANPPDMMGFMTILHLDTFNIIGELLWVLYKDICKQDLRKTIGLIRACQFGFISERDLHRAIDEKLALRGNEPLSFFSLDVDDLLKKVEDRLPNFKRAE